MCDNKLELHYTILFLRFSCFVKFLPHLRSQLYNGYVDLFKYSESL